MYNVYDQPEGWSSHYLSKIEKRLRVYIASYIWTLEGLGEFETVITSYANPRRRQGFI